MNETNPKDFIHKEYPKQFAREDFWSQIKRTVNGQPVSEQDINLIVDQIRRHLNLTPHTHLLDIGCGNGALAARLFPFLSRYTGVDFSAYLLEIANEFFRPGPHINYVEADARKFAANYSSQIPFDKVLVYGCMSYLAREEFREFLKNVHRRFEHVTRVFVGNIPDINRAADFFSARQIARYELNDTQTPVGVWWDPGELAKVGEQAGFSTRYFRMPPEFYGHRYRFDAVFERNPHRQG